jgi:hypothetical protein
MGEVLLVFGLRISAFFRPSVLRASDFDWGLTFSTGYKTMHASGSRLEAITKELRVQWLQTKDYWADAKAQEFEQRYLQELFATVDKTVAAIEQIDKLVTRVRKDCE